MKVFYVILFFAVVFVLAYLTWLNKNTQFSLSLTPPYKGYFYQTDIYPVGFWLSSSLVVGFITGYIIGILKK